MIAFAIDKKSAVPFYRQIVDMVLAGVCSGVVAPGEKLPTIRELAVRLEVNPNTVVKAYSTLQLMGLLDTEQGTGVFVRAPVTVSVSAEEKRRTIAALCGDFVARAQLLNVTTRELIACLEAMQEKR